MIINTNTAINPLYAPSAELGRTPMEALQAPGIAGGETGLPVFTETDGILGTKTAGQARAALGAAPATILRTGALPASGWEGTEPPYIQEIAVSGLPAGAPGVIGLFPAATRAQYDAAAAAGLFVTDQGAGNIIVSATADSPAIDIPFLLQAENRETEFSAILSAFPAKGGGGGGYIPPITESDFTYTGDYTLVDDGDGNWRLKFLSSGTLTPKKDLLVDVFLVGGGGAGGGANIATIGAGAGGGGGYTATHKSIVLLNSTPYTIVVGAGGVGVSGANGGNGGASSFDSYAVLGGYGGFYSVTAGTNGGNGGSGGGAVAATASVSAGNGGSNGGNGTSVGTSYGGNGQGANTLEFGETGAEVYAAGGGGGLRKDTGGAYKAGDGGAGGSASLTYGGGTGGTHIVVPSQPPVIGGVSPQYYRSGAGGGGYGAGGGGCGALAEGAAPGGNGCQGIAIIRNHRAA